MTFFRPYTAFSIYSMLSENRDNKNFHYKYFKAKKILVNNNQILINFYKSFRRITTSTRDTLYPCGTSGNFSSLIDSFGASVNFPLLSQ